jgi:hypothetical protein
MLEESYPFTLEQVRRLQMYKSAVEAGFYTDRLPSDGEAVQMSCDHPVEMTSISDLANDCSTSLPLVADRA